MSERNPVVERLEKATPCAEDWNAMEGTDSCRICQSCKLNVFNLASMSEDEIVDLARSSCLYERFDGTVIKEDCPVGLRVTQASIDGGYRRFCVFVIVASSLGAFLISVTSLNRSSASFGMAISQSFSTIVSQLGHSSFVRNRDR